MPIKHIISKGIGFSPGGPGYIVTGGFGSLGGSTCTDLTARTQGGGFVDNFTRSDSSDLGSDWTEFSQVGSGLEIETNAVVCQTVGHQGAAGFALANQKIEGDTIEVRFNASSGMVNSNKAVLIIFARNSLSNAQGQHYRLEIDSRASSAAFYRTNTLLVTLDLQLDQVCRAFVWRLTNQPGQVRHEFYQEGALIDTVDDTAPNRITAGGWCGIGAWTDDSVVPVGQSLTITIDAFAADPLTYFMQARGRTNVLQSWDLQATGQFNLGVAQYDLAVRGRFNLEQSFDQEARGRFNLLRSFDEDVRGRFNVGLSSFDLAVRGRFNLGVQNYGLAVRSAFRIERTSDNRYEFFLAVDGAAFDFSSPTATFTSLPHVHSALPAEAHTYHAVTRKRNQHGLVSQNVEVWELITDDAGADSGTPPTAPVLIDVQPAAGGAVTVTGQYGYLLDGQDAADTWLIYLTSDGSDPDPGTDTPEEVTLVKADGLANLNWTSNAFTDGLTIKALLRVRNTGGGPGDTDLDSASSAIDSCVSETDGPDAIEIPGMQWGSVASQNLQGVV